MNEPARPTAVRPPVSVLPVLVLVPFSPGLEPNGFVFRISVPLFSVKKGSAFSPRRTASLRVSQGLSLPDRRSCGTHPGPAPHPGGRRPGGCLPARPAIAGRTPSGFAAGAARHPHDSGALVPRLSSLSLTASLHRVWSGECLSRPRLRRSCDPATDPH